ELLARRIVLIGYAYAGTARTVRPDHKSGGVNVSVGFGEIDAEIHLTIRLERRDRLNTDTVFSDIEDFAEIQRHAGGITDETCVRRGVGFKPRTAPTFGEN